jgi:hypothetical protein
MWNEFDEGPYDLPLAEPFTLASYTAGPPVKAYVEHLAIGGSLPEMPLVLSSDDRFVPVPLDLTHKAAYQGGPVFWRDVLEGRTAPTG